MTSYTGWMMALVMVAVSACSQTVGVRDANSLPDGEVATILGGGLPNLRAVDRVSVERRPILGKSDARVAAGSHTLLIDYQPCWNSNLCGLRTVEATVVLQPGRSYEIRHRAVGCSLWRALTAIGRSAPLACRNFLWMEDRATGTVIWGDAPGRRRRLRPDSRPPAAAPERPPGTARRRRLRNHCGLQAIATYDRRMDSASGLG